MLSPMQHPTQNNAVEPGEKSRPEDLNIKSFVSTKPLPVPTPSREATLTQKLELALGTQCGNSRIFLLFRFYVKSILVLTFFLSSKLVSRKI